MNGGKAKGVPLFFAATYGRTEIAIFLIEKGADVNAIGKYSDGSQCDPIIVAAIQSGSFDIVKSLVEHGAKLEYSFAGNHETAVQTASSRPSKNILEYLEQIK